MLKARCSLARARAVAEGARPTRQSHGQGCGLEGEVRRGRRVVVVFASLQTQGENLGGTFRAGGASQERESFEGTLGNVGEARCAWLRRPPPRRRGGVISVSWAWLWPEYSRKSGLFEL